MEVLVLPKDCELSAYQLGFLDEHFKTREDTRRASHLFNSLNNSSDQLDNDLLSLHRNLIKRAVSWISRSFGAKTALQKLDFKLGNLSLHTCNYGFCFKQIQQILFELSQLAKELRTIENIKKYVDTTLDLEALVGDLEDAVFCAVSHSNGNIFSAKLSNPSMTTDLQPKKERLFQALKALNGIEEVLDGVSQDQPQWHLLVKSVDTRVDKSLAVLRPQVFADHRLLLASIGWPPELVKSNIGSEISGISSPLALMGEDQRECYCQSVLALCTLQHLQTRREKRQLNLFVQEHDLGLWAVDELVSPIASRVEYHFLRWVEEPEYIFALMYRITRDLIVGVDDVLAPLIDRARLRRYTAKEAWVSAMVQILSAFFATRVFPALAERYKEKHERSEIMSSWLHLIDLIIAFDKRMQSLLNLESGLIIKGTEIFEGLSRRISILKIFCDRLDWLNVWAKIELKDALKKLKAELKDKRAWLINNIYNVNFHIDEECERFLLSKREHHKSPVITESALRIAWEMIDRSRNFPAIIPRIHFIRSTTTKLLWYFLKVLLLRCKTTELHLDGPHDDSLMTICGSINAARHVGSKLQEWSDDVNFLEMTAVENDSSIHRKDCGTDDSCFFGEEINSFLELETNWLVEIITALLRQFETLGFEYIQNKVCFEQEQEDSTLKRVHVATGLVACFDFVESLDALSRQLNGLKMGLNAKDFLDLWRSVADGLDHFIFCSILTRKIQFSSIGMNLFEADMQALFLVFKPFCARPEAFFPCIRETLKLLKLSKGEVQHLRVVSSNDRKRREYLLSFGISDLSLDQVDKVLSCRKL